MSDWATRQRNEFREEIGECMVCRSTQWLQVHEIARGMGIRRKTKGDRRMQLVLCRAHHEAMGDYSRWPIAAQLAVKYLKDWPHYDRVAVNEARGRAPNAISIEEVGKWVSTLCQGYEGFVDTRQEWNR